jgi:hypothetical protein
VAFRDKNDRGDFNGLVSEAVVFDSVTPYTRRTARAVSIVVYWKSRNQEGTIKDHE